MVWYKHDLLLEWQVMGRTTQFGTQKLFPAYPVRQGAQASEEEEKNHALLSRNFLFFPLVHEIKCPDAQTIELRPSFKLHISFYFFIQAL